MKYRIRVTVSRADKVVFEKTFAGNKFKKFGGPGVTSKTLYDLKKKGSFTGPLPNGDTIQFHLISLGGKPFSFLEKFAEMNPSEPPTPTVQELEKKLVAQEPHGMISGDPIPVLPAE